jgi:hypothetical protein
MNHNYKIVDYIVQSRTLWISNNDDAQLKPWNLDVKADHWKDKVSSSNFQITMSNKHQPFTNHMKYQSFIS